MGRGFISGLIWGAVVSGLVVALASLLSPAPQELVIAAPAEEAPPADGVAVPAGSEFNRNRPETTPLIPEAKPTDRPVAAPAVAAPQAESAPTADTVSAGVPQPDAALPQGLDVPSIEAPLGPRVTEQGDSAPTTTAPTGPSAPSFGAGVPSTPTAPTAVPTEPLAPPPAAAAPEGTTTAIAEQEVAVLTPRPQVTRLPTIGSGDAPGEEDVEEEPVETADEGIEAGETDDAESAANLGALARNSAPFAREGDLPLLSLVLVDVGGEGLDLATLTTFSFPVTFAIDPTRPGAAEAADAYRAAGYEVLILADGLPENAKPSDVEVLLGGYLDLLPQAIGVVDTADNGFQTRRDLVNQVVEILSESGHGLLTYDRGLNAAQQIAEREGVPAALVFRELDASKENTDTIKRYLDRAAFRAGQDGQVVMIGRTYPETVTALFSWALEARSRTVKLAPLSAVMRGL
ncbi:MAG: divergent polysaccharide deacetylase family protein [Pseudomonadota bacterium]